MAAGRTSRGRGPSAITTHHPTTGRPQSAHTRRAYAADWQAFAGWCAAAGQPALPATPEAVAGHLASLAGRLGPSGLRRRLAAIADRHRRSGHPWDPAQPTIRATLHQLAVGPVAPARPAAVLDEAALRPLLASCGEDLAGRRDRALFLLAQASGWRRATLVALDRKQLRFTAAGVMLETGQGRWSSPAPLTRTAVRVAPWRLRCGRHGSTMVRFSVG